MEKSLIKSYEEERRRMLESCIECGLCIKKCPIIEKTELKELSPPEIQKDYLDAVRSGVANEVARARVNSCMECYKCVEDLCPRDLKPMLVHEALKRDFKENEGGGIAYNDQRDKASYQRILASIQVAAGDYRKLFTATEVERARYVFFPGCNVFYQPEKVQEALAILDLVTDEYAYVPGLDYCCGDNYLFMGDLEKGEKAMEELVEKVSSYDARTLILWCPTCQCRFQAVIARLKECSFEVISYPQFLARNLDKLCLKEGDSRTVTLHEPCKSAFLGVDTTGVRDLLGALPGIELTEMPRHKENTSCCGSGAVVHYPQSFAAVRDERLQEAAETKADLLVDVCHFCHQTFAAQEENHDISVVNYVSLLAEALGLGREDKLVKYIHWNDVDRILEEAQEFIEQSPYTREEIRQALTAVIGAE